jgi:hypothetical protein
VIAAVAPVIEIVGPAEILHLSIERIGSVKGGALAGM